MMNTVANTYNTIAKSFDKTRYSIWNCVKVFISRLDKNDTIIEIGCGNGKNLMHLQSNGFKKVSGCDISSEFVNICTNKQLNVIEADILNLPYQSNTFDAVLCVAVIHHLITENDRIMAIKELFRITKQNGLIFISVTSVEKPFSKHCKKLNDKNDFAIDWNCSGSERFYHLFEDQELEKLCNIAKYDLDLDITSTSEYGNWIVVIKKF
jgi:ubiquinone/menaquinone biosynthesis C-methylase UbiE